MTTLSPLGTITKPEDDDPLAQVYSYIQSIVDKLDQVIVRKAADEAVVSSTVLQNDDHLMFAVESGKSYIFDLVLFFDPGANSSAIDAKVGFSFPGAAASLIFGVTALDPATASGLGSVQVAAIAATSGVSAIGVGVIGSSDPSLVRVSGSIEATASGTVRLMWAQNTSSANSMTLLEGSYLRAQVIA